MTVERVQNGDINIGDDTAIEKMTLPQEADHAVSETAREAGVARPDSEEQPVDNGSLEGVEATPIENSPAEVGEIANETDSVAQGILKPADGSEAEQAVEAEATGSETPLPGTSGSEQLEGEGVGDDKIPNDKPTEPKETPAAIEPEPEKESSADKPESLDEAHDVVDVREDAKVYENLEQGAERLSNDIRAAEPNWDISISYDESESSFTLSIDILEDSIIESKQEEKQTAKHEAQKEAIKDDVERQEILKEARGDVQVEDAVEHHSEVREAKEMTYELQDLNDENFEELGDLIRQNVSEMMNKSYETFNMFQVTVRLTKM